MPHTPDSLPTDSTLVLILHAFTNSPTNMVWIEKAVKELKPGSHIVVPQLPLSRFSFEDPVRIARNMVDLIDTRIAFRQQQGWPPFRDIILIGHSIGALLARKIYVLAGPECADARFEGSRLEAPGDPLAAERPWFRQVSRIILFAGMNRGWTLNHHLHFFRFILWWLSTFFAETLMAFTKDRLTFILMNSRRGAPFLTQLRLQWLALQRAERLRTPDGPGLALTIQMLGTIDDMVAPSDNIDLATGGDFVYLDVPHSGHASVIDLDNSDHGRARFAKFRSALCDSASLLRNSNRIPSDQALLESNCNVDNVIFVMHGIRDTGYWTQKIARKVEQMGAAPPRMYASETSSYGYFPMISFLLPAHRRKKVEWLMDRYVEARSLYPNARFSYVGHSNGTYLVARALLDYPGCRFDRIVFAGSVVRTDYDWGRVIRRGQVEAVLNYVASADIIVAVLPGAWEMVNLQDLGSAGHNGFTIPHPAVRQVRYVKGGHSSALSEDNWNEIASFIVSPAPSLRVTELDTAGQTGWVVALGKVAPMVWLAIVIVLWYIGRGVVYIGRNPQIGHPYIALAIYLWLIWQVLSKV